MIACYISGHGFGHASRTIEVLNALGRVAPAVPVSVRTPAPRWLFDLTLTRPVDLSPLECDTGIIQIDSLQLDAAASIARAAAFHETLDERAAAEAQWLDERGARLVIGDIPPLAFAAAAAAGLPSIAVGNFTWDWIYAAYEAEAARHPALVPTLASAYARADLSLRLPMHGGFQSCARVIDIPFIARRSSRAPDWTRRELRLPSDRPLVLLSFGGYGLRAIDLGRLGRLARYRFVVTADLHASRRNGPAAVPVTGDPDAPMPDNVVAVDEAGLYRRGLRYEDLVAAVDVVATKPGYGIIAECAANDTALVYTSRGRFIEYDVLVEEMPKYVRTAFIANDDLASGHWEAALDDVLTQERPPRPDVAGAETVAGRVVQVLSGPSRS